MKCFVTLLFAVILAIASPTFAAQIEPHPGDFIVARVAGTDDCFTLSWHGVAGYTYFALVSDTAFEDPDSWSYAPFIEYGTDDLIQWCFRSSESRAFVRLEYTDLPVPDGDPEAADFDGDGVPNGVEIFQQAGNPFQRDTDGDGLPDGQDPDPLVAEVPGVTVQYHWRHGDAWKPNDPNVSRIGSNSTPANSALINRAFTTFDPSTQAVGAMGELPTPLTALGWLNQQGAEDLKAHVHACLAPDNYSVFGNAVTTGDKTADCTEFEVRVVPALKVRFPVSTKFLQVQRSRTGTGDWLLEALPAGVASQVTLTAPAMTAQQQQNQNQQPLASPAFHRILPLWTGFGIPNAETTFRREVLLLRVELYDERRHLDLTGAPPAQGNQPQINPGAFVSEGAMAGIAAHQPGADGNAQAADASDAPAMPQLVARIAGAVAGTTLTARWRLRANYVRGNGARPAQPPPLTDTVMVPAAQAGVPQWTAPIAFNSQWRIFQDPAWTNEITQNGFFGGDAELFCWVTGQVEPAAAQPFLRFTIGGLNPADQRCRHFIDQQAPLEAAARVAASNLVLPQTNQIAVGTGLWFAYAIAKSETRDYNNRGLNQNTRYNHCWEAVRYGGRWRTAGQPLWGGDRVGPGGYGLFQVTGTINASTDIIPRQEIWNWQNNVQAGLRIVAYKKYGPTEASDAVLWMRRQRNANNANGTALPNYTVLTVTFSDGTAATMEDAVAIKAYNGASKLIPNGDNGTVAGFRLDTVYSGHHCYWHSDHSEWGLNRFNSLGFNYVDRVCSEVGNP